MLSDAWSQSDSLITQKIFISSLEKFEMITPVTETGGIGFTEASLDKMSFHMGNDVSQGVRIELIWSNTRSFLRLMKIPHSSGRNIEVVHFTLSREMSMILLLYFPLFFHVCLSLCFISVCLAVELSASRFTIYVCYIEFLP